MVLKFWPIMGTICGLCVAPFTGGTSLTICMACAGMGFVAGSVIEKISTDDKANNRNLPPEAYNLQGKSMEENNRLREELSKQLQEKESRESKLETKVKEAQQKSQDPNLSKEEREQWKNEHVLLMNELRKERIGKDELREQLTNLEKLQADIINRGNNLTNKDNWSDMTENLKPNFTTKLIIAGMIALIIYFLMAKN